MTRQRRKNLAHAQDLLGELCEMLGDAMAGEQVDQANLIPDRKALLHMKSQQAIIALGGAITKLQEVDLLLHTASV